MSSSTAWGQPDAVVSNRTGYMASPCHLLVDAPDRTEATRLRATEALFEPHVLSERRHATVREVLPAPPRTRVSVTSRGRGPDELPLSTSDMLGVIRTSFSLNISELARVLRVERPTVYAWLKDENEPQRSNRERIVAVWRLAQRWREAVQQPLRELKKIPVIDGDSILELLSDEPLRIHPLTEQLDRLARLRSTRAKPTRGRGGRDAAALLGVDKPVAGAKDRIAFETGQATGNG